MFRLNTSAAEIALGYLEFLCRPLPTKTKRDLGDAVKIAMKAGLSHKAAEQKLQSLGYKVKNLEGFSESERIHKSILRILAMCERQ